MLKVALYFFLLISISFAKEYSICKCRIFDIDSVEKSVKKILDAEPNNVECLIQYASIYLKKGKLSKGFEILVEAHRIDPKKVKRHKISKIMPFALKVTMLKEKAQKNKDPRLWKELADGYFEIGILDEAILAYKQSLKLNPKQNDTRFKLALAYRKNDQIYSSLLEFKKVLEEDKNNFYASYYLAKILKYNIGNLQNSLKYFKIAKELLLSEKEKFKDKKFEMLLNDLNKELSNKF